MRVGPPSWDGPLFSLNIVPQRAAGFFFNQIEISFPIDSRATMSVTSSLPCGVPLKAIRAAAILPP